MALTNYWLSGGSSTYPASATPTFQTAGIGTFAYWDGPYDGVGALYSTQFRLTVGSWSSGAQTLAMGSYKTNYSFTTTAQSAGAQFKLESNIISVGWVTVFDRTLPISINASTHIMRLSVYNDTSDGGESYSNSFIWGTGYSDTSGDFQFDVAISSYNIDYYANTANSGTVPLQQTGALFYQARYNTGNLAKTGYNFSGWNTLTNGQGTTYLENERVPSSGNLSANLNLYAKWLPKTFKAIWDGQGGTPSLQENTATYNANLTFPTTPTRTYYTFGGWWTGINGTGTQITGSTVFTGLADTTYYAKWILISYTITYVSYSGVHANQTSYTYGSSITLSAPTRIASTFDGWYDNANFTGSPITSISPTDSGNKTFYAKYTVDSDATLVWDANKSDINSGKARVYVMENLGFVDINNRSTIYGQGFAIGDGDSLGTITVYDMHRINNLSFYSATDGGANNSRQEPIRIAEGANLSVGETGRTLACQFNNCGFSHFAMAEWGYYNGGVNPSVNTQYDAHYDGLEFNYCQFSGEANFIGEYLKVNGCGFAKGVTSDISNSTISNNDFSAGYGKYDFATRMRFYPWRRNVSVYNNNIYNNNLYATECEEVISIDQPPIGFLGKVTAKTTNSITLLQNTNHTSGQLAVGQTAMFIDGVEAGQHNQVTAITNNGGNSYTFTLDTSEFDLVNIAVGTFVKVARYFAKNTLHNNYIEPVYTGPNANNIKYRDGLHLYGHSCGNVLTNNTVVGIGSSLQIGAFKDSSISFVTNTAGAWGNLTLGFNARNVWDSNTASNARLAFFANHWYFGYKNIVDMEAARVCMNHFDPTMVGAIQPTPSLTCTNLTSGGGQVRISCINSLLYSGDATLSDIPIYSGWDSSAWGDVASNGWVFQTPTQAGDGAIADYSSIWLPVTADMPWINKWFTRGFTGNAATEPDMTYTVGFNFAGGVENAIPNQYVSSRVSVFYNTNNGQGATPTAQTFKTTYTIKDGSYLTKNGGEFLGWSTNPVGPVVYEPFDVVEPATDLTLYAIYENTSTLNIISWF